MHNGSKQSFENISLLLRAGIGLPLFYVALSSFLTPDAWIGFLPRWAGHIIRAETLLVVFSLYEIVLGLWLLSGKWILASAFLSFCTIAGIVIQNIGALDIVFRDVSMLFIALSLIVAHWDSRIFVSWKKSA